ncbi:MAG: hypothetical protein IZT56_04500 [Bacteroidetes bacterium]|nr:hypothetical protein [Bacteroidota bacterium]
MKKLFFSLIAICMLSVSTQAQSDAEQENFFQTLFGMEKQVLVESFITPSVANAPAFWEIYDAYEVERKELGKKGMLLLKKYVDSYGNTTDDETNDLVDEMRSSMKSRNKLIDKYYKKIRKISAVDAGAFYQIESFIAAQTRVKVLKGIPFFGEF